MCWHKWTLWEEKVVQMTRIFPGMDKEFDYVERKQQRKCYKCGLIQERKI
jgi:hypothetical protein